MIRVLVQEAVVGDLMHTILEFQCSGLKFMLIMGLASLTRYQHFEFCNLQNLIFKVNADARMLWVFFLDHEVQFISLLTWLYAYFSFSPSTDYAGIILSMIDNLMHIM